MHLSATKGEIKMAKYKICVTEHLAKTVEVEAKDFDEAYNKVVNMYKNKEIVLTSEDYLETDFEWDEG